MGISLTPDIEFLKEPVSDEDMSGPEEGGEGASIDESVWMGDTKDEEDELEGEMDVEWVGGDGNNKEEDDDEDKDGGFDDDDDDKDIDTDDTSLSGTTLVNDYSMDEDSDDSVEIILGDVDTDEDEGAADEDEGGEWFGNAGP